jgi:hypothetical protein
MKIFRASEIGAYLYCQRAWWYQKNGYESANLGELAAGSELHRRHGRAVIGAGCLQVMAYLALLAALIVIVLYLVEHFLV